MTRNSIKTLERVYKHYYFIIRARNKNMATVMTNLKISQDKVQLAMARKEMNPYDLCSAAGISYAAYRRIMKEEIGRASCRERV